MKHKWGITHIKRGFIVGWWRTRFTRVHIDHVALGLWEITILHYPKELT